MHRRAILLCLVLCTLQGAVIAQPRPTRPTPVFKHRSVDQAWQAAQQSKRPLLLFIHSDNCRFCVKMERETLAHPKIARALAASAETVSVRKEDNAELVERLKIRAYPTTVIIAPDGKEAGRVEGFLDPREFVAAMFGPKNDGRTAQREGAASERR